ncbi:hypothetical protein [Sandaracinus amylolyticus]|uniref:hypothetical protein n=1 Tax=Sandaracinus amylolyticus TaxID=927083 RepID=UPI001F4403E3|nr:hypothetical protein [Sandaracinus amylolyticus]UJR85545.1 Hypothetical protein I5071_76250 [Sandaracinus amylolyticus]
MRTSRWLLGLVLLIGAMALAGGCRSRRAVSGVVTSGGERPRGGTVQVGGGTEVAHGSPREQLEQYDRLLRAQQYVPVGPATHGTLQPNGITAYMIDVQRGHCYSVALFGAQGTDVNLVMLDPAGRAIGHDVRPDEHPWVSFCAARPGRFVARIQMARGQGEFFFAPYFVRGRQPVDLAGFFGGAASGPQVAQIDEGTTQRLAALDQQMSSQRYQRIGDPSGLLLRNREERVFALSLEQGRCYSFATLGGPGTTDTDVFLQDGSGQRLQADTRTDRDAMVQYCAPDDGNYTLQVRNFGGEGPVFTVAYAQQVAGQAQASEPVVPVIATTSSAGAGLDENFALLDADMRARGYESLGESQRGQLAEGGEQSYAVSLEGGKCYAILAVGDSGVRDMSLSLRDAAGREVDRDEAGDARPTARVCPEQTGNYTMAVRMVSGTGGYVYAAYRWPRGTRLGDLAGILYVRLAEVTALLNVEGFLPDPGYSLDRGRLRREGQTATHSVQLSGGQCYSIVVVGGEGVRDLDVALSQGATQVASDVGARNAFPSVRHCASTDGQFTVTVSAASGAGDYVYQIFSQQGGQGVGQ